MTINQNKSFKSVRELSDIESLGYYNSYETTNHLSDRFSRWSKAIVIGNDAKLNKGFIVDKGHEKGAEIHLVTTSGCIFVYNKKSRKLITVLIARVNQVKRLYTHCGLFAPQGILNNCILNSRKQLNKI